MPPWFIDTSIGIQRYKNDLSLSDATFSVAGEYVIQAVVDDGSLLTGTYCCWVNSEVKVTVK